jgi:hypothetical protein
MVRKRGAARIFHNQCGVVLNRDPIAKDVLVAPVAVACNRVWSIQGLKFWVPLERKAWVVVVAAAVLGAVLAIKGQARDAKNTHRGTVKPPVDEVKVVACLVHKHPTRVPPITVPAPKVVGAMHRI